MDELLARQTPHSVEAEQAVIGAILFDPTCVPKVIELLQPDDFYIETNRAIFDTISSMFTAGQKIDPVTVLDEMKALGYKDKADRSYFLQLIDAHILQRGGVRPHRAGKTDAAGAAAGV